MTKVTKNLNGNGQAELLIPETSLQQHENTSPTRLIEMAIDKGVNVEQLEKLLELQTKWEAGEARKKFFQALADFQSEVPVITKNKKVSFNTTNYQYATLDHIVSEIKPYLKKHGLAYRWEFADTGEKISVKCILTHVAGHSEETTMTGGADSSGSKNSIQQRGSSLTYLQRYTMIGALGIGTAQEDTDAAPKKEKVKPTISDKAYSDAYARISAGEFDLYDKVINAFSLTDDQLKEMSQLVPPTK